MKLDLDRLRNIERAATPAPWECDGPDLMLGPNGSELISATYPDSGAGFNDQKDAEAAVAARNALPDLLDRIEALEKAHRDIAAAASAYDGERNLSSYREGVADGLARAARISEKALEGT